jgi:hypothetical protein
MVYRTGKERECETQQYMSQCKRREGDVGELIRR